LIDVSDRPIIINWGTTLSFDLLPDTEVSFQFRFSAATASSFIPAAMGRDLTTKEETFPLAMGMHGEKVKALQRELVKRWRKLPDSAGVVLPPVDTDGYFGEDTEAALISFNLPTIITEDQYKVILDGGIVYLTTGRKVRVKFDRRSIVKHAKTDWAGTIEEELDNRFIPLGDSKNNTGVWVLGLGQPVKLMNCDDDNEEFEFVDVNAETICITILSRMKKLDKLEEESEWLEHWIEKATDKNAYGLEWWANAICKRLYDKERLHKAYIQNKLQDYETLKLKK
jgi:hypothetical protein